MTTTESESRLKSGDRVVIGEVTGIVIACQDCRVAFVLFYADRQMTLPQRRVDYCPFCGKKQVAQGGTGE